MFSHTFSNAKKAMISYDRGAGQIDTELGLTGGEFVLNNGTPDMFRIPGNIWFTLDNSGAFGGILTIEDTGAGLGVNLRMQVDKSDTMFLMSLIQNFKPAHDGVPFMIFYSGVQFSNQITPYTGIDKMELSWTKEYA